MFSGDLDGLRSYTDLLSEHSDSIGGWATGGRIYYDYINLLDEVDTAKQVLSGHLVADIPGGDSLGNTNPSILCM